MAKFRDEVEILIAARDQASAEMRRVREEVKKTRAELGEQAGVVAGAAKLHGTLLKVGAAAEGVKSAMVGTRAAMQAFNGDGEQARETLKEMGFGIGEIVRQTEALGTTIGLMSAGITEAMLKEEAASNARHRRAQLAQQSSEEAARKAGRQLAEMVRQDERALELVMARTAVERDLVQMRHRQEDVSRRIAELRRQAADTADESLRKRVEHMARLAGIAAEELRTEQRMAEARKIAAERAKEQAEAAQQALEAQREQSKVMREAQRDRVGNFLTSSFQSALSGLQQQRGAIADRRGTIALGAQSGRFVTGLRDQAASREDRLQDEVRRLREDLDNKIAAMQSALSKIAQAMTGDQRVQLIPASIGAGRVF